MLRAVAYAKINLGLRVSGRRADGFHPVSGIFQSVSITDRLSLAESEVDSIEGEAGRPIADGFNNLAFRAASAVRTVAGSNKKLAVTLAKEIPAAAGLGGGSADAAAGLALGGRLFGVGAETLAGIAPQLGSDVPFCLVGGTARVSGRGEIVTAMDGLDGFALAVVVPPIEISTPAAFSKWDEMGEPEGLRMNESFLPPPLRGDGDLRNDLYPAAVALAADLGDWRAELEEGWSRPTMLSGSGPSLYGFFLDEDEARAAVASVPAGARFAEPCSLVPVGWRIADDE